MNKRRKDKENVSKNQKTLDNFLGKKNIVDETFAIVNKLEMLEVKLWLTIDMKNANGLDFVIPATSSSNSSNVNPLNQSSNISIELNRNEHDGIATNTPSISGNVTSSSSSTSTTATINVSASLTRKFNFFILVYINCKHLF